MILILLLIVFLIWLVYFLYRFTHGVSGISITTKSKQGQIKIACVGDSITYGHGITGWPRNTYPSVLQKLLGKAYHVSNFGANGRSVQSTADRPYISEPHYRKSLSYQADIVIFMMGTNDAKVENWHGAEAYRTALETILNNYNQSQVIICTPAAALVTNETTPDIACYGIRRSALEEIVNIVRTVAQEQTLPMIDIHALTAENPQWYIADGIHPGNAGACAIAKHIHQFLMDNIL